MEKDISVGSRRFVKISVDIRKHWIYQDAFHYHWWSDLIMSAAWKGYRKSVGQKDVVIKRGQQLVSVRYLQKRWRYRVNCRGRLITPSHQRISGFLRELERHGMVMLDKQSVGTIVTICNYDKYQSKPGGEERPADERGSREVREETAPRREESQEVEKLSNERLKDREMGFMQHALESEDFMCNMVQRFSADEGFIGDALLRFTKNACCIDRYHSDDSDFRSSFYDWCCKKEKDQIPPFEVGWRARWKMQQEKAAKKRAEGYR